MTAERTIQVRVGPVCSDAADESRFARKQSILESSCINPHQVPGSPGCEEPTMVRLPGIAKAWCSSSLMGIHIERWYFLVDFLWSFVAQSLVLTMAVVDNAVQMLS